MFKVNDYVIYNSEGVYKIIDIKKDKFISNREIDYYVLQPAYNNNLTIKTPVNNPKVLMRRIITKDDVLSLIATMPERETIWIEDDRKRNEDFKAALKTGKSEEWVKLIKTIYLKKQEKNYSGKKISKLDEDIMKAAEKNLYEEFAVALNISPDEVVSYILDHGSKQQN
jgi:CarD family transcriptional regulator